MDRPQRVGRRSVVELAYADYPAQPSWRKPKQRAIPGPLFDAVAVTLFLVLGIGLLF
jgi:hypothetical protein